MSSGNRDADELPEGGSADLWADGWRAMGHADHNEAVEAHIERHFGHAKTVIHEVLSKWIHLDINVIPPSRDRDFTTYVTNGMSDLPMSIPPGVIDDPAEWAYAELVAALPGPPEDHVLDGGEHYVIEALRMFGRYVHAEDTWVRLGHTLRADEKPGPIGPDTDLAAYLLAFPIATALTDSEAASVLDIGSGRHVHFYALFAIHPDELKLAMREGSLSLVDRLEQRRGTEVYDPRRPSSLERRPGLDLSRFFRRR